MAERMEIVSKLLEAYNANQLVACHIPYGAPGFNITFERRILDEAMAEWRGIPRWRRGGVIDSVRSAIKRTAARLDIDEVSNEDMNDMAADVSLWLAYELLYAKDGKRWLIDAVPVAALRQALN